MESCPPGMEGAAEIERAAVGLVTLAQHESGSVFPIDSFREIAPELPLVMDAAQAFGKIALHPERLGPGWVVISGHKIGGLSGVGAVV